MSQVQAAQESRMTKQRIGALIKTVLAAAHEVLPHWEHVDVWLPPGSALHVRRMAEEALSRLKSET
ncbi:TrfB-related DNA-binding protein [Caballeronia sp. ATUFL_F2_KS9A]|uniref:TrfB-related DNA-binding protein n=1 Tax=Caballeronia sp. ATUFL_F2_KS9A TaxID=2921777 RepID=UPI0032EB327E